MRIPAISGQRATRRSGMTTMELMIAIAITSILLLILVPTMVYYARVIKGIRIQQRMQQQVNLFVQNIQYELTRANEVEYVSADLIRIKSNENVLVPDPNVEGLFNYDVKVITLDLEFDAGGDNDAATIGDNRITYYRVKKAADGSIEEEERGTFLQYVSRAKNASNVDIPIFDRQNALKTFVKLEARLGDRTNPSTDADDRYTGMGYQGFNFRTILTPTN